MNRPGRLLAFLHGLYFIISLGCCLPLAASEPTPELSREAFKSHKFPWYDAKNDRFKPLKDESEPAVSDRNLPETDFSFLGTAAKVLMWALLAALVVGILIVAVQMVPGLQSETPPGQTTNLATIDLKKLEALPEPAKAVLDLLGEAARLASESSYGSAMTYYYSWQLLQLDQQHALEIQKAKTNRQYAREVGRSKPQIVDLFRSSIRLFEDAFFGGLPVSQEEFLKVWEQRDQFAVPQRRPR